MADTEPKVYTEKDASLCRVFDMLVDRLDRIESTIENHQRAQEHASDLSPKEVVLSGLLHSDIPLQITKMYDGMLDKGRAVIVEMDTDVFETDILLTKEWASGKVNGRFDTELRAKWGDEKFTRFKTACARFYETCDDDYLPPSWEEVVNAGGEFLGDSWPLKSSAQNAVFDIVVRHHVPELLGLGQYGIMLQVPKGSSKKHCSIRDIITLVRRVFVLMGRGDVPHDDSWKIYEICIYKSLARAVMRGEGVDEEWGKLKSFDKFRIKQKKSRDVYVNEFFSDMHNYT